MQRVDRELKTGCVEVEQSVWPGIFIEGAKAATFAIFIEALLGRVTPENPLDELAKVGLAELKDLLNQPRDEYAKKKNQ